MTYTPTQAQAESTLAHLEGTLRGLKFRYAELEAAIVRNAEELSKLHAPYWVYAQTEQGKLAGCHGACPCLGAHCDLTQKLLQHGAHIGPLATEQKDILRFEPTVIHDLTLIRNLCAGVRPTSSQRSEANYVINTILTMGVCWESLGRAPAWMA